MKKRILIDARWAGPTGIGKFYQEIYSRRPTGWEYIEFNGSGLGSPLSPLRLTMEITKNQCDGFWTPGFFPPLYSPVPAFVTIHDLIHVRQYGWPHRIYYKTIIAPLAARCAGVFTVSKCSKEDIVNHLGLKPSKVCVVSNACSSDFDPSRRSEAHISQYGRYIFYAGNRRQYKNIPRLIQGFLSADIASDIVLMLSGDPDFQLLEGIHSLRQRGRIRFSGRIADADMPMWYASSLMVAFLSYDEGFGLPVVEGMASGVPVLASNVSAIPEVAGDGAYLVDPYSEKSIADGIEFIVGKSALRDELVRKGLKRVQIFSWDTSAKLLWGKMNSVFEA